MRNFKEKEFIRIVTSNGFVPVRQTGSHRIFKKGNQTMTVPVGHKNHEINAFTGKRIIKTYNLKV